MILETQPCNNHQSRIIIVNDKILNNSARKVEEWAPQLIGGW